MSAIQNIVSGTAAASFIAGQIGKVSLAILAWDMPKLRLVRQIGMKDLLVAVLSMM